MCQPKMNYIALVVRHAQHSAHSARYAGPPMAAHVAKLGGRSQCTECRQWLALGASNDAPAEVEIEIRAAELAGNPMLLSQTIEFSFTEHMGWFDREVAGTRFRGVTINMVSVQGWHAGYLARLIAGAKS